MSPPSKGSGWSAADEQLLGAVRAAVGETHELLGAVGRDMHGLPTLVARELATGELEVLLLDQDVDAGSGAAELKLVARRELDDTIPAPDIPCPACRAPQRAWTRSCAVCGSEVDGGAFAKGVDPTELLDMVRRSTAGEMDVLGAMSHAGAGSEPGAPVFFARERSTHELVAMRLAGRTLDAAGRSDITLGVIALPGIGTAALLEAPGAESLHPARVTPAPGVATVSLLREALAAAAEPAPMDARVCPQCGAEYPAGVRFCARDGAALRARAASNDLVGQIVAEKYLVLRKLGAGGMGEVYLARHVHMGRECALKIMRRELTDDVDAAGRFRREAASASRVNHPNIATIYDFGETADSIAYIVMEYVDGEPLSTILSRETRLEPSRAVAIARQIADALGAAHDLGIVHRDLKPDNVMITRSHGAEQVKVVDFGIAKAIQAGSRQLTRTGYVLGTPAYMSPEQIMGGELDGRSDQYNLACIVYEMLTGQATFAGTTGEVVIHRRLTEPPPHPRKLEPSVPRALDAAVAHALARTPEERFPNAAEFGAAMAGALESRGAAWSPFGWLSRGKGASAHAVPAPPAATPPRTQAPPLPSAGLTTPRVRPPTGASTASAMRVAPTPEPPTSPPVARPKWPGSGGTSGAGTSGAGGSGVGGLGAGGSGAGGSVPAGAYGAQPSGESSPGVAVTGEQTGEQSGERYLESAVAHASGASVGGRTAPGALPAAPATRPARALGRLAVVGGIVAAGAVGAFVYLTRSAPEPDSRTAVAPSAVAASGAAGTPIAGASTDSVGAAAGATPGASDPPSSTQPTTDSSAAPSGAPLVGQNQSGELEAQIARQAALARAARARAAAAGASAHALDEGDSLLKSSLAWQSRGNYTNALRDGLGALQSWTLAERAAATEARQSAVRSSATVTASPGAPTPSESAASAATTTDPVPRQPSPARDSAPVAPAARTATSEAATTEAAAAAGVLRGYVAALSRRDLAGMRKLWPSMPDNTARGFQDLFELATNFSASLTGEPAPRVNGSDADAELRYSLDYFLSSQGARKQSFRLHAVMRRDGDRWTIRSLEPIR